MGGGQRRRDRKEKGKGKVHFDVVPAGSLIVTITSHLLLNKFKSASPLLLSPKRQKPSNNPTTQPASSTHTREKLKSNERKTFSHFTTHPAISSLSPMTLKKKH